MTILVTTPPANDALTLASLKNHLRITNSNEDSQLQLKLSMAINTFQHYTNIALVTQTVRQTFDQFPTERNFMLERYAPTISSLSIKYYDVDNTLTTLATSVYGTADRGRPAKIFLLNGQSWPADLHADRPDAVEVEYTVGYGADEDAVPEEYKHCIAMMAGDAQNFREDTIYSPGGTIVNVTWQSQRLMDIFKVNFYEWASQSRQIRSLSKRPRIDDYAR